MNTLDVLNTLDPHARLPGGWIIEPHNPWDDLKHRRGRFKITSDLIKDAPETMLRLFGQMIIVRAEHSFMNDVIEYDAYSPLFRVVHEGYLTPIYTFEFQKDGETVSFTAVEVGT